MATNQNNNIHINSFTKGMNTDTSYDMVSNEQYVFGKNIRITKNQSLGSDYNSNYKEGILSSVCIGDKIELFSYDCIKILATASIENIGVIITKDIETDSNGKHVWSVYRITERSYNNFDFVKIFTSNEGIDDDKHKISIVLNKEQDDVIKLYIADGVHLIMQLNIDESNDEYNKSLNGDINYIMPNRLFPDDKVKIVKFIDGKLKASQVQYTYRFYKKYGVCSKLAPLTNKIQIISTNRNQTEGNKSDSITNIGVKLKIDCKSHEWINTVFDKIQVFRLQYINSNEDCIIDLICDKYIQNIDTLNIEDCGIESLQQLSIEEFQSLFGLDIIPQCIEQNQGFLFASNIKDETVLKLDGIYSRTFSFNKENEIVLYREDDYEDKCIFKTIHGIEEDENKNNCFYLSKYSNINHIKEDDPCKYVNYKDQKVYGADGNNVSWKLISTAIPVHDNLNNLRPNSDNKSRYDYIYYIGDDNSLISSARTTDDYLYNSGISALDYLGYDDKISSSMFRSLRKNEVYRYGIVYYNQYGNRSDVQWIDDIRTPNFDEFTNDDVTKIDPDTTLNVCQGSLKLSSFIKYELVRSDPNDNNNWEYDIIVNDEKREDVTIYKDDNDKILFIPRSSDYDIRFNFKGSVKCDKYEYPGLIGTPVENTNYHDELSWCYNLDCEIYYFENNDSINGKKIKLYSKSFNNTSLGKIDVIGHNDTGEDLFIYIRFIFNTGPAEVDTSQGLNGWEIFSNVAIDYKSTTITSEGDGSYVDPFVTQLSSFPIGLNFNVNIEKSKGITGFQIVRCSKKPQYCSNVHQCFVTAAYKESYATGTDRATPYLPKGLNNYKDNDIKQNPTINEPLLLFSPFISTYPESTLSLIKNGTMKLMPIFMARYINSQEDSSFSNDNIVRLYYEKKIINDNKRFTIDACETPVMLTWDTYFSNIQLNGSEVTGGTLGYMSATTTVKNFQYVNAVINGNFGRPIKDMFWYYDNNNELHEGTLSSKIGIGPKCIVTALSKESESNTSNEITGNIVTLQHDAVQYAGTSKEDHQYDIYYGFGNYCKLHEDGEYMTGSIDIFDGDVYEMPCELIHKYKVYNTNSTQELPTEQIITYVMMETEMNTYFNYGNNYRNTSNSNIQPEPGYVEGYFSQDKPDTLYNTIYSDNNISNDVYNAQSIEKNINTFTQRTYYSDLKTNGENIDSWQTFKPLNYIDVDSRYGQVTNLLSNKDLLYYWQTSAFGKFNVNERSLISDTNSNQILLGVGGVVQKPDYLDIKHGMRKDDFSAIIAENRVFWIDILNKAIMTYTESAVNYSEQLNVQNIINKNVNDEVVPYIDYDQQNYELICKYSNEEQLIFNLKLNCASSIYNRKYDNTILLNNTLYGLLDNEFLYRMNNTNDDEHSVLSPKQIRFVSNLNASETKTFDNQEIVLVDVNEEDFTKNKNFEFFTNIYHSYNSPEASTNREGNVKYAIPRYGNQNYGNRLRGKWMCVDITDTNPDDKNSISHVITKFRQSFS